MSNDRSIKLFFTDGTDMTLSFSKQEGNPHMLAKRVQMALDSRQMAFEINNELLVVPTNNIKFLRMDPCPDMLPDTVIVGGTMKSSEWE